jgi:hypothetical protein
MTSINLKAQFLYITEHEPIRCAILRIATIDYPLPEGYTEQDLNAYIESIDLRTATPVTGCIWFQNGSVAIPTHGNGFYWKMLKLPPIPLELIKQP